MEVDSVPKKISPVFPRAIENGPCVRDTLLPNAEPDVNDGSNEISTQWYRVEILPTA